MLSYSSVRDEEAPKRGVDAQFIIAADQLPETNTRETTKHTHTQNTLRERERERERAEQGKMVARMDGWMLYTTTGTSHSISLSYI
jgi:hypothetical protein